MAKDPAFLFYYVDFQHGTRKMTFEEKGCYIELLCEQADCGHLSIEDIKRSLKDSFPIWESLCKKFSVDPNGKYFNEILEKRQNERKKFVKSRLDNLMGSHMDNHMDSHMENRNRDRNRKVIKDKTTIQEKPTNPQVKEFIDYWHVQYLAKKRHKYAFTGGKEGELVKNMLKSLSIEELKRRADLFLDSYDSFILEAGYTIGVFHSQLNKLVKNPMAKYFKKD